jgi:hypothetical protein
VNKDTDPLRLQEDVLITDKCRKWATGRAASAVHSICSGIKLRTGMGKTFRNKY